MQLNKHWYYIPGHAALFIGGGALLATLLGSLIQLIVWDFIPEMFFGLGRGGALFGCLAFIFFLCDKKSGYFAEVQEDKGVPYLVVFHGRRLSDGATVTANVGANFQAEGGLTTAKIRELEAELCKEFEMVDLVVVNLVRLSS